MEIMKERAAEAIRTFANKKQINEIEALYFLSGAFGDRLKLQDAIDITRGLIEEKLIEP